MDDLPPPVEYTGSAKALNNSKFYSAADLIGAGMSYGQAATVTIDKILVREGVVSQFTKQAETMRTMLFVGKKKEFRINQTALKKLIELFGDDVTLWKGQKVQLVLTQYLDNKKGEMVDTILLRGLQPQRAPQPAQKPVPTDNPLVDAAPDAGTGHDAEPALPF